MARLRLLLATTVLGLTTLFLASAMFGDSPSALLRARRAQPTPVTPESLILYRAYSEQIDASTARIRLLFFAQCNQSDAMQLRLGAPDGLKLKRSVETVEGECPWHWAPSCEWNAFFADSTVELGALRSNELFVFRKPELPPVSVPLVPAAEREDGLAVCVPPMYWFDDWLRLAVFVESWKLSGASHFFFFAHSLSVSVNAVLQEYVANGTVTLVPWPALPSSLEVNPNDSVYRYGHLLALNDCRLRAGRKFVTVLDVDEFVLPLSSDRNLLAFLEDQLRSDPLVSSFVFKHNRLHLPHWPADIIDWRASDWFAESAVSQEPGPPKAVFLAERTNVVRTHSVFSAIDIYKNVEVPPEEARLFHARVNWIRNASESNEPLDVFRSIKDEVVERVTDVLTRVDSQLPEGLKMNSTVSAAIGACLSDWKTAGCKTPDSCFDALANMEDWIVTGTDDTTFVVV